MKITEQVGKERKEGFKFSHICHLAGNASMFDIEIRASFHVLFDIAITILNECSIFWNHRNLIVYQVVLKTDKGNLAHLLLNITEIRKDIQSVFTNWSISC